MREYDVDSGMSLYKLREYMDRELGFSPDQMTVFDTLSAAGKFSRRIGLFDFGDGSMDMITIDNTVSHEETVLRYVYNLTQNLCRSSTAASPTPCWWPRRAATRTSSQPCTRITRNSPTAMPHSPPLPTRRTPSRTTSCPRARRTYSRPS